MKQYIDTLQDVQGNALVGATVLVQNYLGGGNASIFSDNGLTPIATSTVVTGSDGQFSFFVADGDYNLVMSKNSTVFKTQSPVSIFDGTPQITYADTGSVNAYATSNSTMEKALRTGLRTSFKAANTNTGPSTYAYNGLAAKNITFPASNAINAGAIVANGIYRIEYDGTEWQLIGSQAAAFYGQTAAEIQAGVTPANTSLPPGQVDRYFTNTTPGTTDATAGFTAAILQAQQLASGVPIGNPVTVNSLLAIASSVTIPAATVSSGSDTTNTVLLSVISGSINIASGKTLTINGLFQAPKQTCFEGAGAVVFAAGSCNEAYPEWWGARGDSQIGSNGTITTSGTDCTAAIAAALLACAGGSGLMVGLIPIKFGPGTYLTGAQSMPPATRLVGSGRNVGGLLAKTGTTGVWFGDTGNAAKIMLEDLTWYCAYAASPGMTNGIKIGYTIQWGTAGYMTRCAIRDCACASSGYHINVNQNVAYIDMLEITMNGLANQSGLLFAGSYGRIYDLTCVAPGSGGTGINISAVGSLIDGLEIEAPQSGSTPLNLGGNCTVINPVFSSTNYAAAGGALSNWVTFGGSATTWALIGVNYAFTTAGTGSGTDTVSNGNFLRADGSYFGGNATAVTAYNAATAYSPGNVVSSSGTNYICILATTGNAPPNSTYWTVTTLPYGHGGEGNFFSDNYGQTDQAFTFRLVNTAGTFQHRFAEPGGNAMNSSLIQCINAASNSLTNTPTGADASTAFAAGAKISTVETNAVIFDTPRWPASGGSATQRVGDSMPVAVITDNSSGTALTVICSLQSVNVNGITANRWTLNFQNATTGANFAINTTNIPSGDLIQVACRIPMAR